MLVKDNLHTHRIPIVRAAAVLALGSLLVWWPSVAAAQGGSSPHEGHMAAMNSPMPTNAAAKVMDPQPTIGEITLVGADGRRVPLRDALTSGSPVMVNFIFTTCTTICPVMSAGFSQLARRLAAENRPVRLVSISIDPEYDTPARLREYADYLGARDNWMFLTGSRAESEAAQRAFGAFKGSKEAHSPATYIRRTADGPWERLDQLASADLLMRAYTGDAAGGHH